MLIEFKQDAGDKGKEKDEEQQQYNQSKQQFLVNECSQVYMFVDIYYIIGYSFHFILLILFASVQKKRWKITCINMYLNAYIKTIHVTTTTKIITIINETYTTKQCKQAKKSTK